MITIRINRAVLAIFLVFLFIVTFVVVVSKNDFTGPSQNWCILSFSADSGLSRAGLVVPCDDNSVRLEEGLFYRSDSELVARIDQVTVTGGRIVHPGTLVSALELNAFKPGSGDRSAVLNEIDAIPSASKGWIMYRFRTQGTAQPSLAVPEHNRKMPIQELVASSVFIPRQEDIHRKLRANDFARIRDASVYDIEELIRLGSGDLFVPN